MNIIPEEDLEITSFIDAPPGGQHVGLNRYGIMIKHIPTNIAVVCANQRSLYMNKKIALHMIECVLTSNEFQLD